MFGLSESQLLVVVLMVFLAFLAIGALIVLFLPDSEGVVKTRLDSVVSGETVEDKRAQDRKALRKRDMDEAMNQQADDVTSHLRKSNFSFEEMIRQAGINMSVLQFMGLFTLLGGVLTFLFWMMFSPSWIVTIGIWLIVSFGLPRYLVSFLRKRRMNKFIDSFPDAIDVVIRSVKAGIPVGQAFQIIAVDGPPALRADFAKALEKQVVGLPLAESMYALHESIPLAEVMFLAIVVQVQSESGGSLSGALSNLSGVLRARKNLQAKVQALSQEAKVSAMIIGCLPFVVSLGMFFASPDYIYILLTDETGHTLLTIGGVWMLIGIFIMRKMINFNS